MGWGLLFWGAVVAVTAASMVYVHVTDWRKAGPCSACRAVSLLPLSVFVVGVPVHLAAGVFGVSWWARWPVAFAVLFPLIVFQPRLRRWLHRTDTSTGHLTRIGETVHTSRTSP
jgi:hypothetical protein